MHPSHCTCVLGDNDEIPGCVLSRNYDRSKLEARLGFADKTSRNKACLCQLISCHASQYSNIATANNDTRIHLLAAGIIISIPVHLTERSTACSFHPPWHPTCLTGCSSSEGQLCEYMKDAELCGRLTEQLTSFFHFS